MGGSSVTQDPTSGASAAAQPQTSLEDTGGKMSTSSLPREPQLRLSSGGKRIGSFGGPIQASDSPSRSMSMRRGRG